MYFYAYFYSVRMIEGEYLAVGIVRIVRKSIFNNSASRCLCPSQREGVWGGIKAEKLMPFWVKK